MKYDTQNVLIMLAVHLSSVVLLWVASQVSGLYLAIVAILFSFIGLTNYALIHEACHSGLNTNKKINAIMGMISGWMFPVSFNFMAIAHKVHHINNRTDNEMFDYYYPEDNLLVKYAQWYSILIGIYPPIIPIGSFLMAIVPWIFWLKPWQAAKSSSIIFDKKLFSAAVIKKIRLEMILGTLYWLVLFILLRLDWLSCVILYAAFWFNWSTRQYVTHAFSKRDVLQGAYNLKVSRFMSWVFLNGQWDLVHHSFPKARWQQLAELGKVSKPPIPYWPQYIRQWLGPRPNHEPAPTALKDLY